MPWPSFEAQIGALWYFRLFCCRVSQCQAYKAVKCSLACEVLQHAAGVMGQLRDDGSLRGWRGELYPVLTGVLLYYLQAV